MGVQESVSQEVGNTAGELSHESPTVNLELRIILNLSIKQHTPPPLMYLDPVTTS